MCWELLGEAIVETEEDTKFEETQGISQVNCRRREMKYSAGRSSEFPWAVSNLRPIRHLMHDEGPGALPGKNLHFKVAETLIF